MNYARIACLMMGASVFAEEVAPPAIYNTPALFDCDHSWDLSLTADYIYWKWQQAVLNIATLQTPTMSGSGGSLSGNSEVIFQTPGYTSGFQTALGVKFHGMDEWNLNFNYTWYQNSHQQRATAASNQYLVVSPTLIKHVNGASPGLLLSNDLFSEVALDFDCIDMLIQRNFYCSPNFIVQMKTGLQAIWNTTTSYATGTQLAFVGDHTKFPVKVAGFFESQTKSDSWALGPKIGIDWSWILGYNIKLLGSISGSALYTRYTTLYASLQGQVSNLDNASLFLNQPNIYNEIHPVLESFLGMGWGSYFIHKDYHLELSLGYDFNIYWNQAVEDLIPDSRQTAGNMNLYGLRAQARFDF